MADQWYYGRDGQQAGPVSSQKLKELAEAGDLRPGDLVWKEGLSDWVPASKVKGLFPKGDRISTSSGIPTFGADAKTVVVSCANCKARYKIDEAAVIGNRVTCKACGNRIVVRADEEAEQAIVFPVPDKITTSRSLNDDEILLVRRRLSAFARDIPHHDIENLGEVVTLGETRLVPCYRAEVKTLYEQRSVERREKPYQAQDIPTLEVTEDNIQPWSYPFVTRKEFEPFRDEQIVDNSQAVHDCADCETTGRVTCPDCSGNGQVHCPQCAGSAAVPCPQCRGRGAIQQERKVPVEKKCWGCMGSGISHGGIMGNSNPGYGKRCQNCYGRGYTTGYDTEHFDVPCSYCGTTGQVQCGNCQATGIVTCAKCKGHTYITCPRCEGRTQLVSFLTVVRTLAPWAQTQIQFDGEPDGAVRQMLLERIAADDSILSVEEAEANQIVDILPELSQAAAVTILADDIRELLALASEKMSSECQIVWQKIEVKQTVAAMASYDLNEVTYEAWTIGQDADLLPMRNPFSDLVQRDFESAISHWERGDKRKAIECLCRCRAMASKDQEGQSYLEATASRIPVGLKTAAAASSTMVSAKAKLLSGLTKVSEAVDAVKNSVVGKWLKNLKGDGEMRG